MSGNIPVSRILMIDHGCKMVTLWYPKERRARGRGATACLAVPAIDANLAKSVVLVSRLTVGV